MRKTNRGNHSCTTTEQGGEILHFFGCRGNQKPRKTAPVFQDRNLGIREMWNGGERDCMCSTAERGRDEEEERIFYFYFSDVGTGRVMIPAKSTCKGRRREEEFLNPGGPHEEDTGVLDCNAFSYLSDFPVVKIRFGPLPLPFPHNFLLGNLSPPQHLARAARKLFSLVSLSFPRCIPAFLSPPPPP